MSRSANSFTICIPGIVLTFLVLSFSGFAAQPQQPGRETTAAPATAQSATETANRFIDPDAKELKGRNFVTNDGVLLVGSFYPGHADKETIPVILLHGQGKSREEFTPLIEEMKKHGYAILAFDFRGHGESTTRFPTPREQQQQMQQQMQRQANPNMRTPMMPPQQGRPVEYLEENFKKVDYDNMYKFDWLPFYRFLVHENNEERLNLNKLVIIGVDMGGTVGGQITKQLWANSRGKNVRSLIIISPNYDPFSKTLLQDAKCFHKDGAPLLMMVGQLDRQAKDNALKLREDILGKTKPREDNPTSMSSPIPIAEFPTERQGRELLRESKLEVPQKIVNYIDETLANRKPSELRWRKM